MDAGGLVRILRTESDGLVSTVLKGGVPNYISLPPKGDRGACSGFGEQRDQQKIREQNTVKTYRNTHYVEEQSVNYKSL